MQAALINIGRRCLGIAALSLTVHSLPSTPVTVFALGAGLTSTAALAAAQANADMQLIQAAGRGDLPQLKKLLAAGASVHARDSRKRTALLAATQENRIDAARLLIAAGADVNAKDDIEDSPYLLAGARGYLEILRATLAAGADLKSTNRYGGTALIPACHYGHVETVRELLNTAIDVDHVNRLGWTALLEAIILGDGGTRHTEIVQLLLAHRANPNRADAQGVTPLQHARRRGFQQIVLLLERAGAR